MGSVAPVVPVISAVSNLVGVTSTKPSNGQAAEAARIAEQNRKEAERLQQERETLEKERQKEEEASRKRAASSSLYDQTVRTSLRGVLDDVNDLVPSRKTLLGE